MVWEAEEEVREAGDVYPLVPPFSRTEQQMRTVYANRDFTQTLRFRGYNHHGILHFFIRLV